MRRTEKTMHLDPSEQTIRKVLDACADCDTCRFLMVESCLLFPELYRLYDQENETDTATSLHALRQLAERCTLCGLCPCPNIRVDVIRSKTERVQAEGMPLRIRLLADVQNFGRLGRLAPGAINRALSFPPLGRAARQIAGIHPQRDLPRLAEENFFAWAHRQGIDRETSRSPKVAYFAGCTAGYLFPEVARAAVDVLKRNGISVFVPPQQCCGMPTLLEGDRRTTLNRMASNLRTLLKAVRNGYDLICSCPTCGFLMKNLLKEGAYYSAAYQRLVGAGEDEIKIPGAGPDGFARLKKSVYEKILKDDSYFSSLSPLDRVALAENVMDLGEYLSQKKQEKHQPFRFGRLNARMVYYAPCHQREQGIGSPYMGLMASIPGLTVVSVGSTTDCCGMGGSLGFKAEFHEASMRLAEPLKRKIHAENPEAIITDCLSCRLQFKHLLPYPVYHPIEILAYACQAAGE